MSDDGNTVRRVVGIAAAVVGITAAVTIVLVFIATSKPAWFLFGFEALEIVPVALGIRYASRRWSDPSGLGLACVAGTVLVASGLGFMSLPDHKLGIAGGPVGELNMMPWLAVRGLAAVVIMLCGLRGALGTEISRWMRLIRGVLLLGIALGMLAGIYVFRNASWMGGQTGLGVVLAVGALEVYCLSAGVHYTVKAFEASGDVAAKQA